MENEHQHNGYRITLLATEMDDKKWACQWTAEKMGGSPAQGMNGRAIGTTEDDAKVEALAEAKTQIDSVS